MKQKRKWKIRAFSNFTSHQTLIMPRTKLIVAASTAVPRYDRYLAQMAESGAELTPNGNFIVNIEEIAIREPCQGHTKNGLPCKSYCQNGHNFCFRHK